MFHSNNSVRRRINKVLESYSTETSFDLSCAKNRKTLATALEKSVYQSVPFKIGINVLRGNKKKKNLDKPEKLI